MPATWKKLAYEDNVVKHSLATAINDFLVASGSGAYIKKTLAETRTILACLLNLVEDTTPQLGGDLDLNEFNFVLKPIPSADDTPSGIYVTRTVDTNAEGIGAPLYMAADGEFQTADADSVSTAPCVALAMETGTGSKKVLLYGVMRNDGWNWTVGPGNAGLIYLSTTIGTLTQTQPSGADDVIQVVGWAISADVMFFCPQLNYITHT
jgi:hypothetical protein